MKKTLRLFAAGFLFLICISLIVDKKLHPMARKIYNLSPGTSPVASTKTAAYKFSTTGRIRALYMDKESEGNLIIGNTGREDEFINFLINNGFNAVYAYDLNTSLGNNQGRLNVAAFVERLHALSISIFAVGGSATYLTDPTVINSRVYYQNQMTTLGRPLAKFDGLNLENESWRFPASGTVTWTEWQSIITGMKAYTVPNLIKTDAYIGNLIDKENKKTEAQLAKFIVDNCDDIEMHCYMNSTKALTTDAFYNYILKRLSAIGIEAMKLNKRFKVRVIFSASPGKVVDGQTVEIHMFDYFKTKTIQYAYTQLINSLNKYDWPGKAGIDMDGVTGYAFQDMKAAYAFH